VGLGTMIAAISIPFFSFIFEVNNQYFLYSTSLLATFIIFAHRSNIQRIIKGTENRFEKARIFHRSNDSD
jgi:glycerol-3-phosphate acyltransferase PlsY